jgi:hypothetical protein
MATLALGIIGILTNGRAEVHGYDATASFGGLNPFIRASFKTDDSWTWTDTEAHATATGRTRRSAQRCHYDCGWKAVRRYAGTPVMAYVGGKRYLTYTDSKGQYRFGRKFVGPVRIVAGKVQQVLPKFDPAKSIDFKL